MDKNFNSAAEGFEAASNEVAAEATAMGQRATEVLDSGRQGAARGVQHTADAIRPAADRLPDRPREVAGNAADMLDGTARYLREKRPQDMLSDLKEQTKANPVAFLLAAVAVGFLAGRMLRRG
jgi:hypothetical protein